MSVGHKAYTMEGCATCGADDEILFACGFCDREYCTAHQFPHHACDRFGDSGDVEGTLGDDGGFVFPDRGTDGPETGGTDPVEAQASAVQRPAPGSADERPTGERTTVAAAEPARPHDGGRRAVVGSPRPAGGRADRNGGDTGENGIPIRPMDVERPPGSMSPKEPETVREWMHQQTYLTFLTRVGGLALLLTTAYYATLFVVLYDPLAVV